MSIFNGAPDGFVTEKALHDAIGDLFRVTDPVARRESAVRTRPFPLSGDRAHDDASHHTPRRDVFGPPPRWQHSKNMSRPGFGKKGANTPSGVSATVSRVPALHLRRCRMTSGRWTPLKETVVVNLSRRSIKLASVRRTARRSAKNRRRHTAARNHERRRAHRRNSPPN